MAPFVDCHSSRGRYDDMYILGDVNVRYNGETGEFKMTGSYGVPRSDR